MLYQPRQHGKSLKDGLNENRWYAIVIMIVRKGNPEGRHIGLYRCHWIHKKNILLPDNITSMNAFADFIQSQFGEGRYYISGDSKKGRHRGFYTIFLGSIKNKKAIGRGKIKLYVEKNKEKLANKL